MTSATPPATPRPVPGRTTLPTSLLVATAASVGAGLVHAAAAGSHAGDATLQWTFAVVAVAQVAWAALALARGTRWVLGIGIALNGAALAAWAGSRTVGLVGPLADVEPVGAQDLLAAVLAAVAVAATITALVPRLAARTVGMRAGVAAVVGVLALAVPAMAVEHTHGPSHEHDHAGATAQAGGDHATGDDHAQEHDAEHGVEHDHGSDLAPTADPAASATGPIVSVDDARLTPAQRRRAGRLLEETRAAMTAFPDEASLVAAGYRSIGDGRRAGSFEHYVKAEYLADGRELDPEAIESVVLQRQADGSKTVASAMFILETGSTMADVPDIAGELTAFHDHQNLCWDETGTRLAGVLVGGQCRPGGTLRPTPPMLHVWLEDTPCGPFTGIEGHGGGCEHDH